MTEARTIKLSLCSNFASKEWAKKCNQQQCDYLKPKKGGCVMNLSDERGLSLFCGVVFQWSPRVGLSRGRHRQQHRTHRVRPGSSGPQVLLRRATIERSCGRYASCSSHPPQADSSAQRTPRRSPHKCRHQGNRPFSHLPSASMGMSLCVFLTPIAADVDDCFRTTKTSSYCSVINK